MIDVTCPVCNDWIQEENLLDHAWQCFQDAIPSAKRRRVCDWPDHAVRLNDNDNRFEPSFALSGLLAALPDGALTASSVSDEAHAAPFGRLIAQGNVCWMAGQEQQDEPPFFQMDLGTVSLLYGVVTQGCRAAPVVDGGLKAVEGWVERYTLQFRDPEQNDQWLPYVHDEHWRVEFNANSDAVTPVLNMLPRPLRTRFLRIVILEWHGRICLRAELVPCRRKSSLLPVPDGWCRKFSKSIPGAVYYIHKDGGEAQWEHPSDPNDEGSTASDLAPQPNYQSDMNGDDAPQSALKPEAVSPDKIACGPESTSNSAGQPKTDATSSSAVQSPPKPMNSGSGTDTNTPLSLSRRMDVVLHGTDEKIIDTLLADADSRSPTTQPPSTPVAPLGTEPSSQGANRQLEFQDPQADPRSTAEVPIGDTQGTIVHSPMDSTTQPPSATSVVFTNASSESTTTGTHTLSSSGHAATGTVEEPSKCADFVFEATGAAAPPHHDGAGTHSVNAAAVVGPEVGNIAPNNDSPQSVVAEAAPVTAIAETRSAAPNPSQETPFSNPLCLQPQPAQEQPVEQPAHEQPVAPPAEPGQPVPPTAQPAQPGKPVAAPTQPLQAPHDALPLGGVEMSSHSVLQKLGFALCETTATPTCQSAPAKPPPMCQARAGINESPTHQPSTSLPLPAPSVPQTIPSARPSTPVFMNEHGKASVATIVNGVDYTWLFSLPV